MSAELLNVDLYTDGACSGNPGAGGWGFVLKCKSKEKQESGFEPNTTNNQMELMAVIKGVQAINKPCNLTIYTDSAYVHNAFAQHWIENWLANGFKTAKKQEVANKELWLELLEELKIHKYKFVKVKGHSDNFYNNVCDKLATTEIKNNMSDNAQNSNKNLDNVCQCNNNTNE